MPRHKGGDRCPVPRRRSTKDLGTVPLNWKEVHYTNCPLVSASNVDQELSHKGADELLANSLVVFVALVPFFAVKELGRVLGEQKISDLFFRRSAHP